MKIYIKNFFIRIAQLIWGALFVAYVVVLAILSFPYWLFIGGELVDTLLVKCAKNIFNTFPHTIQKL